MNRPINFKNILQEMSGISYEAREWAAHIHPKVQNIGGGQIVINGRDDIELYEMFSVDYFVIEINENYRRGTGAYDEQRSGFDNDVYCVYLILSPNPPLFVLNHELRHAFEDYKRITKGKPKMSQSKEGYNLFSGDFTDLMTGQIKTGEYSIFPDVIKALYYTSKLEESAYGETMYDELPNLYYDLKRIVNKDYADVRYLNNNSLEQSWEKFKNNVKIPIISKFNDYKSFLQWADKTIKSRGRKFLNKLLKIKYLKNK